MASVRKTSTSPCRSGAAHDSAEAPLRDYARTKQAVSELIRELHQIAARSSPWTSERVHELLVRLAEDRFQLVVVGQFKRGKSSLMNAIVGRPLLPTAAIPVTSVVTSLRYGPRMRATIRRAGRVLDDEIPVESLAEFVTERGNPDNHKQVLSADVEVPVRFLRRGLRFIDTPGIGSAQDRNTATTLAFLPEADAAIFVTGADAPLSDTELDFLGTVRQHVRKLFFVLNKIDQVRPDERNEVLTYTSQVLATRLGVDTIRLFPVSAGQALTATTDAAKTPAATGLAAFEEALTTFLDRERRTVFLVALLDRAMRLLDEMRFSLDLRERATAAPRNPEHAADALKRVYDEQDRQRRAVIERVEGRIEQWRLTVLEPALDRFVAETRDSLAADLSEAAKTWAQPEAHHDAPAVWMHSFIERRALACMQRLAEPATRIAQEFARESQPAIANLVQRTIQLAASTFGAVDHTARWARADQGIERFAWMPPAFGPAATIASVAESSGPPLKVSLPRGIAIRFISRTVSQRIPRATERAAGVLRDMALDYLHACVADLDAASGKALDDERRRVEMMITARPPRDGVSVEDVLTRLQSLSARASAARDSLLAGRLVRSEQGGVAATSTPPGLLVKQSAPRPSNQPIVTATCAICAAMSNAIHDFLCHHQYAIAVDRASQEQFVATRGLCPTHTWHLERLASPRGLADSYSRLLDDTAHRLQSTRGLPVSGIRRMIDELLARLSVCPACVVGQRAEQASAQRFLRTLTDATDAASLNAQWACLKHLRMLVTAIDDARAVDLVSEHAQRLSEVAESMREYVLKMDARRRDLLSDEEARAYRQGLVVLAGERYLVVTEPEE